MENAPLIDLESIARQLKLELPGVQRTVELLDEGNTVPFIERFRKDQVGGLNEQQIRAIEGELKRARMLSERKDSILKSIESRGKLTDKLRSQIASTRTMGELEDIYLPYKPKKQSLASLARSRGLESLATAVLEAAEATPTVEQLAEKYVDAEKSLPDIDAVIEGLKHLIAEHYGHDRQLRVKLRRHLAKQGKLVTKKIDQPAESESDDAADPVADDAKTSDESADPALQEEVAPTTESSPANEATPGNEATPENDAVAESAKPAVTSEGSDEAVVSAESEKIEAPVVEMAVSTSSEQEVPASTVSEETATDTTSPETAPTVDGAADVSDSQAVDSDSATTEEQSETVAEEATTPQTSEDSTPTSAEPPPSPTSSTDSPDTKEKPSRPTKVAKRKSKPKGKEDAVSRRDQRRETRRRRRDRLVQSFKDYFDFSDPLGRVPHHRILAINRGERTKVLRVRIECPDWDKVQAETESTVIPSEHPMADFLRVCLQDAMTRLLQPSIEREVRRQLTERAEEHAVTVFARNLRKLLLQPPLHQKRVVAIDPGFRSGCKLVALDEFGQMLGHTFINLLGKDQQKKSGRESLAKFIREHKATVVAVGNGAACRETETLVAEVLGNELKDESVGYLIVNEAGTSVYSTSELGREELPDMDATVRSAVSIGRRSLDPLSELVKIDPASIGVGLYQHDVKAKHLRESLDDVVESCVNFVGVDVNSASPALLRYVSGLNSLTARKIYEHRRANGPFRNREQLKEVSGVGEASYVQAAGFLKIGDGDTPLDGTWIHPESYEIAMKVLDAIGFSPEDLRVTVSRAPSPVAHAEATIVEQQQPVTKDAELTATAESTDSESTMPEASNEEAGEEAAVTAVKESVVAAGADGGSITAVASTEVAVADQSDPPATTDEVAAPDAGSDKDASEAKASMAEATEEATVEQAAGEVAEQAPAVDAQAAPAPECEAAAEVSTAASERAARLKELTEKVAGVDVEKLAAELGVGKLLLQDILHALARPGRDPRDDLPPPIFRTGILKLEDLKPGMELSGTVLNVVDFGAFVDIGLVDSGLIHVSRLADRYVADPHDVVSVGDILRVWVVEVDQKRRRVSLTAIEPGTEKPKQRRESGDRDQRKRDSKPQRRRPRGGGENNERGKSRKFARGKGQKSREYKPKSPPKPVVPITREMEEGKEPMRTFGDLKQLFEKKKRGGS